MSRQMTDNSASVVHTDRGDVVSVQHGHKLRLQRLATPTTAGWIGFLLSLVFLFAQLSLADPSVLNMWLSSDTLYPVNVFTDVFVDGYSLSGWQFSIAPCWFPDLVLVGLFLGLTHNVILATLLAGFIQIALIVGAFAVIRRAIRATGGAAQNILLLGTGVAITLFVATRPGLYYPGLYQFFLPQTHVGSLWVVLFGLGLALLWIRRTYEGATVSWGFVGVYAVVCAFGGMSNVLFIVQMLVPLTVSLMFAIVFGMLPLRASVMPVAVGWAAALTGALLNRVLFNTTAVGAQSEIQYERVMVSLDTFMRGAVGKLLAGDRLHLLAIIWSLVCLTYVVFVLRKAVRNGVSALSLTERMTSVFFVSCFLSSICSMGAIVAGGSNGLAVFKDYQWSMHYMHSTFLVPLFGLPLTASWTGLFSHPQFCRKANIAGATIVLLAPAYFLVRSSIPAQPIHLYTPPLVRFIDDLSLRDGLRYGIGGYWQARLVTLLSGRGVRVYAVDGALHPLLWVSNRQWYAELFAAKTRDRQVDFVILDDPAWKISREETVRVFGDPVREETFNNTRVLIYAQRRAESAASK
jgi:hypothetical protein